MTIENLIEIAEAARAEVERVAAIQGKLLTARADAETKIVFYSNRAGQFAHAAASGDTDAGKELAAVRKALAAERDKSAEATLALPHAEAAVAKAQTVYARAQNAVADEQRRLAGLAADQASNNFDETQAAFVAAILEARETAYKAGRPLGHSLRQFDLLRFIHPEIAAAAHSDLAHLCLGQKMADGLK